MTPLIVLQKARELLADPTHWTRQEMARDIHGRPVDSCADEAVCWCLLGAINKVADSDLPYLPDATMVILGKATGIRQTPEIAITHFNDTNSHNRIMWLLDSTIKSLK